MKRYTGHIKTGTSDAETFEFEVPEDSTEEEVDCEAEAAFWESGLVDFWWEETEQ